VQREKVNLVIFIGSIPFDTFPDAGELVSRSISEEDLKELIDNYEMIFYDDTDRLFVPILNTLSGITFPSKIRHSDKSKRLPVGPNDLVVIISEYIPNPKNKKGHSYFRYKLLGLKKD